MTGGDAIMKTELPPSGGSMNYTKPWKRPTWKWTSATEKRQPPPEFTCPPGRFPEHHAKEILRTYDIDTPRFMWAGTTDQAIQFAQRLGYPVVAKVISTDIYCKSDRAGVETRIDDDEALRQAFRRFRKMSGFQGILVEERLGRGLELNVGVTKIDFQNGPAVFLERPQLFKDGRGNRTFRLLASGDWNVPAMLKELDALPYDRESGSAECVNVSELERLIARAADLVRDPVAGMEALILDPVRCVDDRCVVLDARIKFRPGQ
jgi:hypothetical protein